MQEPATSSQGENVLNLLLQMGVPVRVNGQALNSPSPPPVPNSTLNSTFNHRQAPPRQPSPIQTSSQLLPLQQQHQEPQILHHHHHHHQTNQTQFALLPQMLPPQFHWPPHPHLPSIPPPLPFFADAGAPHLHPFGQFHAFPPPGFGPSQPRPFLSPPQFHGQAPAPPPFQSSSVQSPENDFDDDSFDQIAETLNKTILSQQLQMDEDLTVVEIPIAKSQSQQAQTLPKVKEEPRNQKIIPQRHSTHFNNDGKLAPVEYLRGQFTRQIQQVISNVEPLANEHEKFEDAMEFLSKIVKTLFPQNSSLFPFGSTACGMHLRGSADMDTCIVITDESLYLDEWKSRQDEHLRECEKSEYAREIEWKIKEKSRIEDLTLKLQAKEKGEAFDDEEYKPEDLKEREYKYRTLKPFLFAHFVLEKLFKYLQEHETDRVDNPTLFLKTRIPIVKYYDKQLKLQVDVGFNNLLAVWNTRLILAYSRIDTRVKDLVLFVKYWAKQKTINDTYHGTLSSYAYVLMIIHYLQYECDPPILPCLQLNPAEKRIINVDGTEYDCSFDELPPSGFQNLNTKSLGELVEGFFDYWANKFDFKTSVVCIRNGGILTKEEKNWIPIIEQKEKDKTKDVEEEQLHQSDVVTMVEEHDKEDPVKGDFTKKQRFWVCIEDPFETGHNLGRPVGRDSLYFIRGEFLGACYLLRSQKNYSRDYLTSIRRGQEDWKLAPNIARMIVKETQYKTREEHKKRNHANMERSKVKQQHQISK